MTGSLELPVKNISKWRTRKVFLDYVIWHLPDRRFPDIKSFAQLKQLNEILTTMGRNLIRVSSSFQVRFATSELDYPFPHAIA